MHLCFMTSVTSYVTAELCVQCSVHEPLTEYVPPYVTLQRPPCYAMHAVLPCYQVCATLSTSALLAWAMSGRA